MVARQKHNRQPALWVIAALKRWWSLSLLLSHVTPHKHTRTRLATGEVREPRPLMWLPEAWSAVCSYMVPSERVCSLGMEG